MGKPTQLLSQVFLPSKEHLKKNPIVGISCWKAALGTALCCRLELLQGLSEEN